jgi:hypothetical protein
MSAKHEPENQSRGTSGTSDRPGAKKTYRKPEFRSERVFEQSALACGKVGATQSGCRFNRKKS